jgi:AbrB family looped-hinge helix DNA binding protein
VDLVDKILTALGKMGLMKSATRVTSKGQVVIPKPVREQLRWVSGTELPVEVVADGVVRLTLLEAGNPIDSLYGCLKDLPRDPGRCLGILRLLEIQARPRPGYLLVHEADGINLLAGAEAEKDEH